MGDGKYAQHRFNLGRAPENAERIMIRLRQLWQHLEATHTPSETWPRPQWDGQTPWIAEEIAKGNPTLTLPSKRLDGGESYAHYFHRVPAHFPFLLFVPENQEQYETWATSNLERIEGRIKGIEEAALKAGNLRRKRIVRETEILHAALAAYPEHVRQTKIETDKEG